MMASGQFHAHADFSPGIKAPSTLWVGDWMGPRAGPDAMEYRKIFSPCQESKPGLVRSPVAMPAPYDSCLYPNIRVQALRKNMVTQSRGNW
jgi:hypothetical protein